MSTRGRGRGRGRPKASQVYEAPTDTSDEIPIEGLTVDEPVKAVKPKKVQPKDIEYYHRLLDVMQNKLAVMIDGLEGDIEMSKQNIPNIVKHMKLMVGQIEAALS